MPHKIFTFTAGLWLYTGKGSWHFVTLPQDIAKDIDFLYSHEKHGWGSLPVTVTAGKTSWDTSIFPDKKSESYILPVKSEVRKKESLQAGDTAVFTLEVRT